jgi:hypothetical protein
MNERIRELIDQATIRGVEYLAGNDGHPTATIYFDKEKFAELIINECVNVAKNPQWYKKNSSNDWCNSITHVCNAMKEHFGVKNETTNSRII